MAHAAKPQKWGPNGAAQASFPQMQSQPMMPVFMQQGAQVMQVPVQWVGGSPQHQGNQACFTVMPMPGAMQETPDPNAVGQQNMNNAQPAELAKLPPLHQLLEQPQQQPDDDRSPQNAHVSPTNQPVMMMMAVPQPGPNGMIDMSTQPPMMPQLMPGSQQPVWNGINSDQCEQVQQQMLRHPKHGAKGQQQFGQHDMWQGNLWQREDGPLQLPVQGRDAMSPPAMPPSLDQALGGWCAEGDLPYYASNLEDRSRMQFAQPMPGTAMPEGNFGGTKNRHNQLRPHLSMENTYPGQPKGPMLKQRMTPGQFGDMAQQQGIKKRQDADSRRSKIKSMAAQNFGYQEQKQGGTGEAPAFEESPSKFKQMWDMSGGIVSGSPMPPPDKTGGKRDHRNNHAQSHTSGPLGQANNWSPSAAETMKAQLQALQLEDERTVFIARRINKLGFSSAEGLRAYFSRYGLVKNVYVSHSRVKSLKRLGGERRSPDAHWRLRAAALGFVVMTSADATSRILADGHEHLINNVTVRLQAFHRRACVTEDDDDEEKDGNENMLAGGTGEEEEYPRWPSPGSDRDGSDTPVSGMSPHGSRSPTKMELPYTKGMDILGITESDLLYNNYAISGGPIVHSVQPFPDTAAPEYYGA